MGVAGVPAGGPAGSPSGNKAGGKPGTQRTLSRTGIDLAGSAAGQNAVGTVPVEEAGVSAKAGDSTLPTHAMSIDTVRLVAKGIRTNAGVPDRGTFQVVHNVGGATHEDARDVINTENVTPPGNAFAAAGGDIGITNPGATVEVHAVGAPSRGFVAAPHAFSLAMRGGSLHTGTLAVHVDLVQGG